MSDDWFGEDEIWSALSSLPSHVLNEIWVNYGDYFLSHQSPRHALSNKRLCYVQCERHLEIGFVTPNIDSTCKF